MKILFSYQGNIPEDLPERIFLDDGSSRTSLNELSYDELKIYGFIPVVIPIYDVNIEKLVWNKDNLRYDVVSLSSEELFELHKYKWEEIKNDIDRRINDINKKMVEQYFQDGKIMTVLITTKKILENITLYEGNPHDFRLPIEVNINLDALFTNSVRPDLDYMSEEELKEFRNSGEYNNFNSNPEDMKKAYDNANLSS